MRYFLTVLLGVCCLILLTLLPSQSIKVELDYARCGNISYPVLQSKYADINKIIFDDVLAVLHLCDDMLEDAHIECEAHVVNNRILSIQYSGLVWWNGAPHHDKLFYTTNIDILTGEKIKLSDIVSVDELLINQLEFMNEYGFIKALWPQQIQAVRSLISGDRYVLKILQCADMSLNDNNWNYTYSGVFTYFTDTTFGIAFPVVFAAGGIAQFEIKYSELHEINISDYTVDLLDGQLVR
jgi:hypothetical protein